LWFEIRSGYALGVDRWLGGGRVPSPEKLLRPGYLGVVTFKVGDHGKGPSPPLKLLMACTR
jgi:hypothetical protein